MEKTFISALTVFIDVYGKGILEQPDRFKSLFLDSSQNKYRAEAQIFSQFLASPYAQEVKSSDDVDTTLLETTAERFHQTYLFDKSICNMMVTAYAWFLGLIDQETFETKMGNTNRKAATEEHKHEVKVDTVEIIETVPVPEPAELIPQQVNSNNTSQIASPVGRKKRIITFIILAIVIIVAIPIFIVFKPASSSPQSFVSQTPAPVRYIPDGFVWIEGGIFTMGSPINEPDRLENEGPQHQVTISNFYMGKFEVTQAEYEAVMRTNPSYFKGSNLPVEQVSWYDAVEYCNRRSLQEGLIPAYTVIEMNVTWNRDANGYRLPTEAEWEYACRAGTNTPFSTGYDINTGQANYDGNYPYNNSTRGTYRERTTPGILFAPNLWGLYDMHGNVWEWCWDLYGGYSNAAQTDPTGAVSRSTPIDLGGYKIILATAEYESSGRSIPSIPDRVRRGGSWYNAGRYLRSASRGHFPPFNQDSNLGFRLVRDIVE